MLSCSESVSDMSLHLLDSMNRKSIFHFLTIALGVLTLLSLSSCKKGSPIEPPPQPDTTSHQFSWHVDTLGIYPSSLSGVWGTDPGNVYAVGTVYFSYSQPPVFIMHWDGSQWTPLDYLEGDLLAIYGFSSKDIWVVGDWWLDTPHALIAHWDGNSWTSWKLQQLGQLFALWGTSSANLYAVGSGGLIFHFDGTSWTQQQSGTTFPLRGVWGADAAHVYATGNDESTGQGTLLQSDGLSWKEVAHSSISDTLYGDMRGVWCKTPEKLTIVGSLCYEGKPGQWTLATIPSNSPGPHYTDLAAMDAVRGDNANNLFITGFYDLIIHWNGSSWHIYHEFFDKTKVSDLRGIWVQGKTVFLTGYGGGGSYAVVYRGTQ